MQKIAIYGKGGIGKSTVTANLAAAMATLGKRVIQIGCDPKADSTVNLLNGETLLPVMNFIREYDREPESIDEISKVGFGNVLCIETGGPTPGLGCAGRGIINALEKLESKGAYDAVKPDVVLYDVLGDVVCGGFAMPMRGGYADKVYIITSGENMSIYAAANIAMALKNFQSRNYAILGGFILNCRNVKDELSKVQTLADDFESSITGVIPRSELVNTAEEMQKTLLSAFPQSDMANAYRKLADKLLSVE